MSAADPTVITDHDIRMFMIDRTSDDNYLLDDVEFSPEQIRHAHLLIVDKYNSTLPITGIVTEIPRYEAILGTAAMLLRSAAINLMRNRLDYSNKSGTAVQDKSGARDYLAMAKDLMIEWEQRAKALKVGRNIESCYGYVGSPYRFQGARS